MNHDYTGDYSKTAVKTIYAGLFNVIAQANMIIKYAEKNGEVIEDPAARAVITGEAYAIRAFCQLDVLRLFGQMPQGASRQVELPYSETTSIDEMPAYYSFDDYVVKLESDLSKAESLLKDNDPLFQYTFSELNSANRNELSDSYIVLSSVPDELLGGESHPSPYVPLLGKERQGVHAGQRNYRSQRC